MEADVLPVEAHATQEKPSWCAIEIATVMPRSLKEPVGFIPWCLAKRLSTPAAAALRGNSYRGVLPSRRVVISPVSTGGSSSRNRQTPLWSRTSRDSRRDRQVSFSFVVENDIESADQGRGISSRSPQ